MNLLLQILPLFCIKIILIQYQSVATKPIQQYMLSPITSPRKEIQTNVLEQSLVFRREAEASMQQQPELQQVIQHRVERINRFLSSFQLRIHNIFSNEMKQKLQILSIIQSLSCEMTKLQENANRMNSYHRKRDQFVLEREDMLDKIAREQKNLENEKQALIKKKENIERLYKQACEKFSLEKEQLQKQLRKIQAREKWFEAEFRKKDNQIQSLQEALRKAQQKNHSKSQAFEVMQQFQVKDRKESANSNSSYDMLTLEKFEDALKQVSKENIELRTFLQKLILQLSSLFTVSQQKTKGLWLGEPGNVQKLMTPSCFNLPFDYALPNLEQIIRNIKMVENTIGLMEKRATNSQQSQKKSEDSSNQRMNILIDSFKEIVKSQNLILNKIMSNQNIFDHEEQIQEVRCCQAVENLEFDKIKTMIEEQMGQIENRTQFLSKKKQMLNDGLAEAENIKQELIKEKGRLFGYDML